MNALSEELDQIYAALSTQVKQAQAGAQSGEINLVGLDTKIRRFCDLTAELPVEQSVIYVQKLEALTEELSRLATSLKSTRDEVQDELMALSGRQQAHKAYGVSSALLPNKPKDGEG